MFPFKVLQLSFRIIVSYFFAIVHIFEKKFVKTNNIFQYKSYYQEKIGNFAKPIDKDK